MDDEHTVVSVYLGEMWWAGVLDLADISKHGNPIFIVKWRIARRHLKDQHTSGPPVTTTQTELWVAVSILVHVQA